MVPSKERLSRIAERAIAACHGAALARAAAAELGVTRAELVGSGKASLAMARGVLEVLEVERGLLVTKDEHAEGFAPPRFEVRLAAHPVPDERSRDAGEALLRRLGGIDPAKHVVAVLSGGTSSLLSSPTEGLSVSDLERAHRALLAAGVAIAELNAVRKHLTRASGGRLARACRAPIDVLVLSDVLGDDLAAIGSGPFAPDPTTFEEALAIARDVEGIGTPVLALLERGARGLVDETPKPGDALFERVRHHLVGSHAMLLEAAVAAAQEAGFSTVRRLPPIGSDVVEAARRYADEAARLEPGALLVSGGEPTVILPADHGLGGRNQQLALLVARALFSRGLRASFAAVGSDGGDGPTDAAGAIVDQQTWGALGEHGDPDAALARADAHPILDAAGALVRTGTTHTNVLDLHLLAAG